MRRLILLSLLPLAACAPEPGPEQIAARRAEGLVRAAGHANATVLAPMAGLDDEGRPGVCGLIETPSGPVRVVVALASGDVRTGVPAANGAGHADLGESRFCNDKARARWDRQKQFDPIGLLARIGG
jgi:hypothetical protein